MKSLSIRLLMVVLGLVLLGCGHHGEDHGHAEDQSGVENDLHKAKEAIVQLALNGAEKWKMDDHTRAVFAKMGEKFTNFDLGSADEHGLKEKGKALRADIDELIAGCTMTGAAHDELHKFLTAYIPAVESLASEGQAASAKKVHGLLQSYTGFFE